MLRYASDCTGLDSPAFALTNLKIPFQNVFGSEIDKFCRKTLKANHCPETLYEDIFTRDHSSLPQIDLYVAGFPCQPYSLAGKRNAFKDPRSKVFFECIKTIQHTQPKYFILENVKGLKAHLPIILAELEKTEYQIEAHLLNSLDFGLPQSRQRYYFLGTRKDLEHKPFTFTPQPIPDLDDYVDWTDRSENQSVRFEKLKDKIPEDAYFINLNFTKSKFVNSNKICPCLMRDGYHYNVRLKRFANINEYLFLQGLPLSFKRVVSDTQLKKQVGNSMSIPVLEAIISHLLSEKI